MTDDEAILNLMLMRVTLDDKFAPALEHLATAMADRAALCKAIDGLYDLEQRARAFAVAREHMRGK